MENFEDELVEVFRRKEEEQLEEGRIIPLVNFLDIMTAPGCNP